jgi:hypothetical protein
MAAAVVCARVVADGLEGLPGDAQDHQRDGEADERVADVAADGDDDRAGDDGEADEPVRAGVVAVGDQGGAVEVAPGTEADLRGDLVADEADDAGGGERPEVVDRLRIDEAVDGFAGGRR